MTRHWLLIAFVLGYQLSASAQDCTAKKKHCDQTCISAERGNPHAEGLIAQCELDCYQREGCGSITNPNNPPPPKRPWDIVTWKDGTDPNGFPQNPIWGWQEPDPYAENLLDPCDSCPCGQTGFAATGGVPPPQDWYTSPTCTNQPVHANGGSLYCIKGHMNWFPVDYEGQLRFEDHSEVFDNDYQWDIRSVHNDNGLLTIGRGDLHTEFDSRETVDDWDGTGTWWENFHHNIVDNLKDKQKIADWFGTKYAIVIGMLGLDLYHGNHHSELHPVYAMFIRLDPPQPGPIPRPRQEHWAFFVRNWGNEGICGPDDEPLNEYRQIAVKLPATKLVSSNVWVATHGSSLDDCFNNSSMTSIGPDGTITFSLPQASTAKCSIVGDLTTLGGGVVSTSTAPSIATGTTRPPRPTRVAMTGDESDEPPIRAKLQKLSPADRAQLEKELAEVMAQPKSGPIVKPIQHRKTTANVSRIAITNRQFKAVPDPAAQAADAKRREIINKFLKAHGVE